MILNSSKHRIKNQDFIYLFIFRERGGEGEREGEKHREATPVCPDQESNP